jgi:hypothetical protein
METMDGLETWKKEIEDALTVMGGLQARHARMLADHAEWLESHQRAMQKHEQWLKSHDDAMATLGERMLDLSTQQSERVIDENHRLLEGRPAG